MLHPGFHKALAYLSSDNVRSLLMDLVDISSPTGNEIGVAQYLIARMRRIGHGDRSAAGRCNRPNAIGHRRGHGHGLNLLFTGHMDTSYSGAEEHLAGEGFQPKAIYRDGWVWGLGANNMKSGLAAALIAIEAIASGGIELAGDIRSAAWSARSRRPQSRNSRASNIPATASARAHLVTHGVTADFALSPSRPASDRRSPIWAVIWLRITVRGTVAHSALANRPNVVNAIAVMHELQSDIAQWARDYEAKHEYMGEQANVTFAAIRGGAPWRLSRNPHECSLYLDIRTVPGRARGTSSATCAACCAPSASAKVSRSRRCTSMSPIRRWCSTASLRRWRRLAGRARP